MFVLLISKHYSTILASKTRKNRLFAVEWGLPLWMFGIRFQALTGNGWSLSYRWFLRNVLGHLRILVFLEVRKEFELLLLCTFWLIFISDFKNTRKTLEMCVMYENGFDLNCVNFCCVENDPKSQSNLVWM